jgi:hypothetical protein
MRFKLFLICTFTGLCLPMLANSEEPLFIQNGFLTGETLLAMSSSEQRAYTMGIVNGLLISPFLGAEGKELNRIKKCLTGMTDSQITAIHTMYLQKNPTTWHKTPHVSFFSALIEVCPKS